MSFFLFLFFFSLFLSPLASPRNDRLFSYFLVFSVFSVFSRLFLVFLFYFFYFDPVFLRIFLFVFTKKLIPHFPLLLPNFPQFPNPQTSIPCTSIPSIYWDILILLVYFWVNSSISRIILTRSRSRTSCFLLRDPLARPLLRWIQNHRRWQRADKSPSYFFFWWVTVGNLLQLSISFFLSLSFVWSQTRVNPWIPWDSVTVCLSLSLFAGKFSNKELPSLQRKKKFILCAGLMIELPWTTSFFPSYHDLSSVHNGSQISPFPSSIHQSASRLHAHVFDSYLEYAHATILDAAAVSGFPAAYPASIAASSSSVARASPLHGSAVPSGLVAVPSVNSRCLRGFSGPYDAAHDCR